MARVLNLRNVPDDLYWRLRREASDAKMGLHAYCLRVLAKGAKEPRRGQA